MPDDGHRYEIVDGVLLVTPAPGTIHQMCVVSLVAVEVQSPSTRLADLGTKRLAYESAGVPSYWMVDPAEPRVTVLRLSAGGYVEEANVAGDQPYDASYPFSVTVVPSRLVEV